VLWVIALWVYVQWFNDYGAWLKSLAAYNETRQGLLIRAMQTDDAPPTDLIEKLAKETPAEGVCYKATPVNVFLIRIAETGCTIKCKVGSAWSRSVCSPSVVRHTLSAKYLGGYCGQETV